MAGRRQDPQAMLERGRRLADIRARLSLSQYDIAPKLNAAARSLGLPESYKYYTVSRNESGTISFEDAAVWLSIDPLARGWDWFVLGLEPTPVRPTIQGEAGEDEAQMDGPPPRGPAKPRSSGAHRKQA